MPKLLSYPAQLGSNKPLSFGSYLSLAFLFPFLRPDLAKLTADLVKSMKYNLVVTNLFNDPKFGNILYVSKTSWDGSHQTLFNGQRI